MKILSSLSPHTEILFPLGVILSNTMFTDFTEELNSEFVVKIQNLNQYRTLDFYYIIEAYGRVMAGHNDYFDAWIYNNNESWCVGFWTNGNYLFNSNNLNKNDLHLINERINFKNFNQDGFHFVGNTKLINALSELNKDFELEIFKERYFYAANQVNIECNFPNDIRLLNDNDVEKIAILYQQYYVEEYHGTNNKPIEVVIENIKGLVSRNLIYKLEIDNEIIGFCTKMAFLANSPNMIGTIFIKDSERNKKYAQHFIAKMSIEMLIENQEIYLMTTKDNIASNRMVENVGYVRQYEHSDRILKNYA